MRYVVLNVPDFDTEYGKAFEKQNLETEADEKHFRDQVFAVQGAVEDALAANWKKPDDFEVGWDFDYCYHTCGGIYSEKVFCKAYVETIVKALKSVDPDERWTYHTVCEIIVNPDAETVGECIEIRGEFFVRGDTCYVNGSTMTRDWRARLGCPD